MADITITPAGAAFDSTDTVTSTRLNEARNPTAALDAGTIVNADVSATADILGSKLADATVTKAKIENVANLRVLGNTSGSVVAPQEVEILDDDTMATADAATLATSESIKAYVNTTAIGVGQTWQNVLLSRSKNTWFQNTTGRPIQAVISIRADGTNDGSVQVATDSSSSSTYIDIAILGFDASESGTTITIPNNYYYRYASTGTFLRTWCELR